MEALTTVQEGRAGPVSAAAGVPLHRQLFLVLHDEIDRGVIAPGDALPTEQTLCDQFGVSRITVRRALADLADQGYIERRHGVGSFVRPHGPADVSGVAGVGRSFMQSLRQTQFETKVEVVELGKRRPPRAVGEALGTAGDTSGELLQIVRVRRQRRTDEPLMMTEAWLPQELAGVLTEPELRRAPLYELLSQAGVAVDRVRHEITAEIAGPRNAHLLGTAIGAALLRINRLEFVTGAPHHYVSTVLSPSRSRVLLSQTAEEMETGDGLIIAHDVRGDTG